MAHQQAGGVLLALLQAQRGSLRLRDAVGRASGSLGLGLYKFRLHDLSFLALRASTSGDFREGVRSGWLGLKGAHPKPESPNPEKREFEDTIPHQTVASALVTTT